MDQQFTDFRKTAITTTVGDYVIDTVNVPHMGWETGIIKGDGDWAIVERYGDEESAKAGHEKWCDFAK